MEIATTLHGIPGWAGLGGNSSLLWNGLTTVEPLLKDTSG